MLLFFFPQPGQPQLQYRQHQSNDADRCDEEDEHVADMKTGGARGITGRSCLGGHDTKPLEKEGMGLRFAFLLKAIARLIWSYREGREKGRKRG